MTYNDAETFVTLIRLAVCLVCGFGGAVWASRKGRGPVLWFFVCFFLPLIGFLIVACLSSKRVPPSALLTPQYDKEKWAALIASDPEVAAAADRLKPYDEQYLAELASTLLGVSVKMNPNAIADGIVEKAKAYTQLTADAAKLEALGHAIDSIFRTARGLVAQLNDGTALAEDGTDLRQFRSLAEYRRFHKDSETWQEIMEVDEKLRFFARASPYLEKLS